MRQTQQTNILCFGSVELLLNMFLMHTRVPPNNIDEDGNHNGGKLLLVGTYMHPLQLWITDS